MSDEYGKLRKAQAEAHRKTLRDQGEQQQRERAAFLDDLDKKWLEQDHEARMMCLAAGCEYQQ